MTAEEKPKAPGLAITSLICGILGFFTCLFTGIPAIITGHLAQSKIKKSEGAMGGKKMALTGTILGYVTTGASIIIIPLAALTTPAVFKALERATLATNIANGKDIHSALYLYTIDNDGKFPTALSELTSSGLISDLSALDYRMDREKDSTTAWAYYPGLSDTETDKIILAGPQTNSKPTKRILILVNGDARAYPEEEAQTMASEQSITLP